MNKKYLWFILPVFIIILSVFLMLRQEIKRVCINNDCFKAELAQTKEQQIRGLMFRECLANDSAMLFIYQREDFYSFWMKNMNFPLDIIWANAGKEIVHIEKNVPPCKEEKCQSYKPLQKAMYVLEISAGLADRLQIKTGDKLTF